MDEREAAVRMNKMANTIFKPIYAVIAKNILDEYKKRSGICLDIGSGPGHMAIEMSKISDFHLYTLDISKEMNKIAQKNIIQHKAEYRIKPLLGNVENLPFENNSVDLIMSRGSVYFWENKIQAFSEIRRVLKKGGMAFIGGGFGNAALRDKIISELRVKNPEWESASKKRGEKFNLEMAENICNQSNIQHYYKIQDGRGNWLVIHNKV